MSIEISKKTLTALAKSVTGDMKHTQKLDAFAKVLGFKDQTALMGTLKAAEAAAPQVPEVVAEEPRKAILGEDALAKFVEAALIEARDGWNARDWHSDWSYEVENGDTNQGYAGWGASMVEQRGEDITGEIWGALQRLTVGLRNNETEEEARSKAFEDLKWALRQLTDHDEPDCFNHEANEAMKFIMATLTAGYEPAYDAMKQVAGQFLNLLEFDPAEPAPDEADDTPEP